MVRTGIRRALAVMLFLASAPATFAQLAVTPSDRAARTVDLVSDAPAGMPIFANQLPSADGSLRAGGTALGTSLTPPGRHNVRIGFDYLRPLWTFRDFNLAVPAGRAGSFPLLGDIGHVDNHFAFAPRLNYEYDLSDDQESLFWRGGIDAVGASGTFLNLTGHLRRQVASATGVTGDLSANSSLTIVSVVMPEVSRWIRYADLMDRRRYEPLCQAIEDLEIEFRLGSRYASIEQNYTGTLTGGAGQVNTSTRFSNQTFRGLGLSGAANFLLPKADDWLFFTNTRVSVLLGDNRKDSSLLVNAVGLPPVAETIRQAKSALIPMAELEMGVEWGQDLGEWFRKRNTPQPLEGPPQLTVRAAITAQFWGDVGPLSAGSTQAYRSSDLFLLGVHLMVGYHR